MFKALFRDTADFASNRGSAILRLSEHAKGRLGKARNHGRWRLNAEDRADEADTKRFPYKPIDRDHQEIRLLELLPGVDDDLVRCTIHHQRLNGKRKPKYETISYCWGDFTEREEVEMNGVRVSAPTSTVDALRHVRLPHARRTVWIDALCIDQDNVLERGHQVALMSGVYAQSTGNLIDLGPSDDDATQFLTDMQDILTQAAIEAGGLHNLQTTCYDDKSRQTIKATEPLNCSPDFASFDAFMSRPWFRRLWVFQEAAVAPTNTCFCGPHRIPLLDIVRTNVWLYYKSEVGVPIATLNAPGPRQAFTLWAYTDPHKRQLSQLDLVGSYIRYIWELQLSLECSDPRDRVYGLLGLPVIRPDMDPVPAALIPDYTRPATEVLRDATKLAICHADGGWTLLSEAGRAPAYRYPPGPNPSWVPTWHERTEERTSSILSRFYYLFAADLHRYDPVLATANNPDPNLLDMRGVAYDRIVHVSPAFRAEHELQAEKMQEWIALVYELLLADGKRTRGDAEMDALGDTLIAGMNYRQAGASTKDAAGLRLLMRHLADHRRFPFSWGEEEEAFRYLKCLRDACRFRSFFVTEKGYYGIGPDSVRENDVVAILYTCPTPFILRPAGPNFIAIGECYVRDIMQGEALTDHEAKGGVTEIITLE